MSKIFDEIKQKVAEVQADVDKFDAGNSAAGSRVRKAMQELKGLAQSMRAYVLETKEARKAK
ncbi:MAG: hypothetical protein R3A50_06035 [Saprospiraceae bacterium]|nr:hypothetical protein [Saprospiraceae bacterium]MCB9342266.1 histone H1 [Lewinellaceae bacterium]